MIAKRRAAAHHGARNLTNADREGCPRTFFAKFLPVSCEMRSERAAVILQGSKGPRFAYLNRAFTSTASPETLDAPAISKTSWAVLMQLDTVHSAWRHFISQIDASEKVGSP